MKQRLLLLAAAVLLVLIITSRAEGQINDVHVFSLPLKHLQVNSSFGYRVHPVTGVLQFHKGIDLAANRDTVYSILDGRVNKIGYDKLTGNYILIDHTGGIQSLYGHLSATAVLPGDPVISGQIIGITGRSGRTTGEHLHFAIKYKGHDISPLAFLAGLFSKAALTNKIIKHE